ncbi:MAG: dihydroorotase [Candidatus Omnitrophica bacterium]|nr:dihydroorotase [Candidatus Omnitrophota bacterium]
MKLAIRNAHIVNHDKKIRGDILIHNNRIETVGEVREKVDKEIDAQGKYVLPGFIDLHTHLRSPGREDTEDLYSGSRAAAKGGFTTIFCMPNTTPALDNEGLAQWITEQARSIGLVDIYPVGAISKGRQGKELTEFGGLKKAGCLSLSDDGDSLKNSSLMRRAIEYAKMFGLLIISHCEDKTLSAGGVMREGAISSKYGIRGIPCASEAIMVFRDIELTRYLNARIHIAHISTQRSVEIIRAAKAQGVNVTCETAPHYMILTDHDVEANNFHGNWKVNPPLGSHEDRAALTRALAEGVIDCIATDHAPHSEEEKNLPFEEAPCGFIGLEWAFALSYTGLVKKKVLTLGQLVEKMSYNPARIAGFSDKGYIRPENTADMVIVDLDCPEKIERTDIVSKSKNSPFLGREVQAKVVCTIHQGKVVYRAG